MDGWMVAGCGSGWHQATGLCRIDRQLGSGSDGPATAFPKFSQTTTRLHYTSTSLTSHSTRCHHSPFTTVSHLVGARREGREIECHKSVQVEEHGSIYVGPKSHQRQEPRRSKESGRTRSICRGLCR